MTPALRGMVLGGDAEPDPASLRSVRHLMAPGKGVAQGKGFANGTKMVPANAEAWTAPEAAAIRTAEELAVNPKVAQPLRDRGYGDWAGRRFADLLANDPDLMRAWLATPETAPPGGETGADLIARVGAWLDALPSTAGPKTPARERIVAVAHPTVVCAAVLHALAAPPAALRYLDVRPLTLVRLTTQAGTWSLAL